MNADILKVLIVNMRQEFADAVDEGLGADKSGFGMLGRLPRKMLAAAKTHFQLIFVRLRKKSTQIYLSVLGVGSGNARQ